MYAYTDFDRRFVRARAAQYRDQLERHLRGELGDPPGGWPEAPDRSREPIH